MKIYDIAKRNKLIEKNKNRIKYVKKLSKNDIVLKRYINEAFELLEDENVNDILDHMELLFYEKVPVRLINRLIKMYDKLNSKQINELKVSVIKKYKNRPDRGFLWNMYHECYIIYKNINISKIKILHTKK